MKSYRWSWALMLCIASFVTSCGYNKGFGRGNGESTICVPYVEGDQDGLLTTAIIRQIAYCGVFEYREYGANLQLLVKVVDNWDENIGFRYDRTRKNRLIHSLIPAETRIINLVEVSLLDVCSNKVLIGPVRIAGAVDFDHDDYTSRNGVNIFSLGQLSDFDDAQDTAIRPLNEKMAKKIIDFIIQN